jgi:hypothetical protein
MHAPLLTPKPRFPRRRRRAAFSMLELLAVIGLIALLLSLAGVVLGRSLQQAREQATKALLLKVDGLLSERLEAFQVMMSKPQRQKELLTRVNNVKQEFLNQATPIPLPDKMAELMVYKGYFKQAFPQTAVDNASLSAAGQYFAGNLQNSAESAEYLYWILTKADTYGAAPVGDTEFSSAELRDTDGDGRVEFVDSWGQPLRFYRWPTRLVRPLGPGTAVNRTLVSLMIPSIPPAPGVLGDVDSVQYDPDDRIGLFHTSQMQSIVSQYPTFPGLYELSYHTPDCYHTPLILSVGPDFRDATGLGLFEPFDIANFGHLAQPLAAVNLADPGSSNLNDNLTNRQKQK